MAEGVFLLPRVGQANDPNSCRQFAQTTAFGTAGLVIANNLSKLYKLTAVNKSATAYYIQVFNKNIAPVNNDLPVWERALKAQATGPDDVELDFGLAGLMCTSGIGIALSSTPEKLTLALADNAFAYALFAASVAAPTVTAISPASGTSAGGTAITITGTGFGGATGATVGGVAVTSFTVVSNTSITAVTGAHVVGAVDVIVTCPTHLGGASAPMRSAYTYT